METLLLPVAFAPETPESFPPQEAPQGFVNFAEVLEKQYFKEENPLPQNPQISPGDPASSAIANSFLAAIWVPNGTAFPQEKPTADEGLPEPAIKDESPVPSTMEFSSILIFPQPSPGSQSGEGSDGMNGGKTVPIPDETPTPYVSQDRERGTPTLPVFFPSGNAERNQETSPGDGKIPENPVQHLSPPLPSNPSVAKEELEIRSFQKTPILPDSSTSPAPSEEPFRKGLAGKRERVSGREEKSAHSTDTLIAPSPPEETLRGEPAEKIDMPLEKGEKILTSSDLPASPASSEEPLRKDLPGKIELSSGEAKKIIHLSTQQEREGSEDWTAQESHDFFAASQPSLKMEAKPRIGEGQVFKRQEPSFGVAKETRDGKNPQNVEERELWVGTQANIPDSTDRELGGHFSGKAGKGLEKALWSGANVRPLPDRGIQSSPSFFGALTDPLGRQVENGSEVKESIPTVSPRAESSEVFQQVGQRVLWSIRNNEERIRITLDPPELGQVFLEIDRHKEHIKTVLWTDNPTTKATLETSQGEIQRIIESEGFKLEKFDVFVQQDPGWFQGRKENTGKPNSRDDKPAAEEGASSMNSMESIPGRAPASRLTSRYLDLFV